MTDRHIAVYGNTRIERGYCDKCEMAAFIIGNKIQCCGAKVVPENWNNLPARNEITVTRKPKRDRISEVVKRCIIDLQSSKCMYCGKKFGSSYRSNGTRNIKKTKIHFDHVNPYSYSENKSHNIVAACSLCNLYKSDKIFGEEGQNIWMVILEIKQYMKRMFDYHEVKFI